MRAKQYLVSKSKYDGNLIYINDSSNGFKVKPKKTLKYDGINVDNLVLINSSFIDKVLKRKTRIRLEYYLKLIIDQMDDDESNPTDLRNALNDLTRYKSIVKNNYSKYLEQKYLKLLLNKISIIEGELKSRILYYDNIYEKSQGKSR